MIYLLRTETDAAKYDHCTREGLLTSVWSWQ